MTHSRRLILITVVAAACAHAAPAPAQVREPLPIAAADVRGAFARFKEDPAIASALGVPEDNIPTRGLGIVAGAHWYPVRGRTVTLGIGGEVMLARGSRTAETEEDEPEGPAVNTRMTGLSPQLSLNFGHRDGWSYVSGGLGWSSFDTERQDAPFPVTPGRVQTINYGGGARWFTRRRLAVSVDLRFYAIRPQEALPPRPAFPRKTIMVISAGVAFR